MLHNSTDFQLIFSNFVLTGLNEIDLNLTEMSNTSGNNSGQGAAGASSSQGAIPKVQRNMNLVFKVTINRRLDQNIEFEDPDFNDKTSFIKKILEHTDAELKNKKGPKRCNFRKIVKNEWDCNVIYQADANYPLGRLDKVRYPRSHVFGTEINKIPMYECQIRMDGNKSGIKHMIVNPYAQGLTDKDKRRLGRYIDDHIEKCVSPIFDEEQGAGANRVLKHVGTGNWIVYLQDRGIDYKYPNIKMPFPFKTVTNQMAMITIVRKETEAQMTNRLRNAGCTEAQIENAILARKAEELAAEEERAKKQLEREKDEEKFRKEMELIKALTTDIKVSPYGVGLDDNANDLTKKIKAGIDADKRLDFKHHSNVEYAKIFSAQWEIENPNGEWKNHISVDVRNNALAAIRAEEARYKSSKESKACYLKYVDEAGKLLSVGYRGSPLTPLAASYVPSPTLSLNEPSRPPTITITVTGTSTTSSTTTTSVTTPNLSPASGSLTFANAASGETPSIPNLTAQVSNDATPSTSQTKRAHESTSTSGTSSSFSSGAVLSASLSLSFSGSPSPKKLIDDYSRNSAWLEQNKVAYNGHTWIDPKDYYEAIEILCKRNAKSYRPTQKAMDHLRATVWFLSSRPQSGHGSKGTLGEMGFKKLQSYFEELYEIEKIKKGDYSSLLQIWRSIISIQPAGNEDHWPPEGSFFGTYVATASIDDVLCLVSRDKANEILREKSKDPG